MKQEVIGEMNNCSDVRIDNVILPDIEWGLATVHWIMLTLETWERTGTDQ